MKAWIVSVGKGEYYDLDDGYPVITRVFDNDTEAIKFAKNYLLEHADKEEMAIAALKTLFYENYEPTNVEWGLDKRSNTPWAMVTCEGCDYYCIVEGWDVFHIYEEVIEHETNV